MYLLKLIYTHVIIQKYFIRHTFPRKGTFFYCVMQAYYKKNIIDDEE